MVLVTKLGGRVRAVALAASRAARPQHAFGAVNVRCFSGNREYPRIEESVPQLATKLNKIGAMLSIPTAALYFTNQKLEYLVRNMKGKDELKEVQRVMLLADAKLVYPSTFTIGTFLNACLKHDMPELALEFVRKADNMRHYIPNQSLVRLMRYYAEKDQPDIVAEITARMHALRIPPSFKTYNFWIENAKKQDKFDDAVALAKEAADAREINAHSILILLHGLEGDALKQQIPLAKYLLSKGDVYPNAKLMQLLADNE